MTGWDRSGSLGIFRDSQTDCQLAKHLPKHVCLAATKTSWHGTSSMCKHIGTCTDDGSNTCESIVEPKVVSKSSWHCCTERRPDFKSGLPIRVLLCRIIDQTRYSRECSAPKLGSTVHIHEVKDQETSQEDRRWKMESFGCRQQLIVQGGAVAVN